MFFWWSLSLTVLSLSAFLISYWRFKKREKPSWTYYWEDWIPLNSATGCISGCVAIVFWLCFGGSLLDYSTIEKTNYTYYLECHTPLVALGNDRNVSGSGAVFLGTGSFNSSGYQTITYVVQRDGYKQLKEASAKDARIVETDEVEPHLECRPVEETYDPSFIAPWLDEKVHRTGLEYYFHVPEGSVSTEFSVEP